MRRLQRLAGGCLLVVAAVPLAAAPQEARPPATLEPTVLEVFAARPDARVIWSRPLAAFVSDSTTATPTVIVVESPSATPAVLRGLRVDFASHAARSCDLKYVEWAEMCRRG